MYSFSPAFHGIAELEFYSIDGPLTCHAPLTHHCGLVSPPTQALGPHLYLALFNCASLSAIVWCWRWHIKWCVLTLFVPRIYSPYTLCGLSIGPVAQLCALRGVLRDVVQVRLCTHGTAARACVGLLVRIFACARLLCSPVAACAHLWPPVSACVRLCPPVRAYVRLCAPMATCARLWPPVRACHQSLCLSPCHACHCACESFFACLPSHLPTVCSVAYVEFRVGSELGYVCH